MDTSLFSIQEKCFCLVGLFRSENVKFPKVFKTLQYFNIFCISYLFVSALKYITEHTDDILASADASSPQFTQFLAMSKLVSLMAGKDKFYQLMDDIKTLAKNVDKSVEGKLNRVNMYYKVLTVIYFVSTILTGVGYVVRPIVANLVNLARGFDYDYEMPFKGSFFYDITYWPAYLLTYIIFSYTPYVCIVISVSFTIVFRRSKSA